jgi:drug/metabolite transporter (DMT)-like permease
VWAASLFLVVVFGFGSAFMLNNIAVADYPPLLVAFVRALVATLAVGSFALWRGHKWATDRSSLISYLAVGILTTALPFAAIAWGQSRIPSSLGGVLFATIPLFTLFFGPAFLPNKRIRSLQLAGAVLGLGRSTAWASNRRWTGSSSTMRSDVDMIRR